ncbi:hypothetical protein ACI7YT_12230 [Microbacterium sp. M]|uniref:hypothetical protein n=1 Tax=Microbacterium sp. M TaxID=3377125 RepID=UPI00386E258F
MGSNVWMGVRGAEQWIKAPAPRTPFQAVGWSETTQGRNGRTTGRRSRVTHMEYELSWPTVPTEIARKLTDMYYGVDGDGLIYWLDPMLKNVLPAHWSFPGLGCTDGPPIYGKIRPEAVATTANAKGLPHVSAKFTAISGYTPPRCYIPIPPGHAAHIGVHQGTAGATDSIVIAIPQSASGNTGTISRLPGIAPSSSTRFTTVIPRSGSMTGIDIRLAPGETIGGVTLPSTGTIAGIMVEVLPIGQSPVGQGFIRGGGNSGCQMFDPPTETPISAYRNRMSVSAKLTEVGP